MNLRTPTIDDALPVATYAFGNFRLDARRLRLTRDGAEVALTPKALAILEHLVRRPGTVVDKQALLAAAWPTVIVEEGNLAQTIYLLRRALGEQPADHRYIVTVPGRGYRFVADVQVVEDSPAVATVAPAPAPITVPAAVSADRGELPSQPSAAPVTRPPRRVPSWTRGAAALLALSCGLAFVGMQWRSGEPAVAAQPSLRPTGTDAGPPVVAAAPADATSRDATLAHAKFLFARRAPGDTQRALAEFNEVLARDPNNADAWTGVAGVLVVESLMNAREPVAGFRAARAAAERALTIDPTRAEAHMRLVAIKMHAGDRRGARESLVAARRFDPDEPLVLACAAEDAVNRGDFPAAARLVLRSVERDPLNVTARGNLPAYLLAANRPDDAEAEARRTYEMYPSDVAALILGQLRLARGDVAGAQRFLEGIREPAHREQARTLLAIATQRGAKADAALRRLEARVGRDDPFAVAEAYALFGDRDRAFAWLERAAPSNGGPGVAPDWRPRWTMPSAPLLASLRDDPRWRTWERAVRAPNAHLLAANDQ
jgi:DNA-binding winged helix-turn-helix (wHTH) protein/Flp pilus assembly protein TadD